MKTTLIFFSTLLILSGVIQARNWKSRSGTEIEAEFVSFSDGMVTLKKADGKEFSFDLARLSNEDQAFVMELVAPGKGGSPAMGTPGIPEVVGRMVPGETFERTADGGTGITYQIYVPTTFVVETPVPLMIAFSAEGNGKQMVEALQASAEKAGWLVVGCDRLGSKMAVEIDTRMSNEVLDDILKSIPHQVGRVYLAGFAGGGLRCHSYAAKDRRPETYAGILAFGAWMGGDERQRTKMDPDMAIAQINGRDDNGANEWIRSDADALGHSGCVVKEFMFDGGHEIAPPATIDKAIVWLEKEWAKRK